MTVGGPWRPVSTSTSSNRSIRPLWRRCCASGPARPKRKGVLDRSGPNGRPGASSQAEPVALLDRLRDAVQMLEGAQENRAVGECRRRVALLTELVLGKQFEPGRVGGKDERRPLLVGDIEPAIRPQDRPPDPRRPRQ